MIKRGTLLKGITEYIENDASGFVYITEFSINIINIVLFNRKIERVVNIQLDINNIYNKVQIKRILSKYQKTYFKDNKEVLKVW